MRYGYWKPYVPVAERRWKAAQQMSRLREDGLELQPVEIAGRKIAKTFWGMAWNDHLESFGDYANRIPRGRTYVRNGSVCHLDIKRGAVRAMVSGSEVYKVRVDIAALPAAAWAAVKKKCAGQVGSMLDLLQGKLSDQVMALVTDRKKGLFPAPREIEFDCDCPDGAYMCKHIAAVLYGVGARLDEQPELLFELRGVDHQELITVDVECASITGGKQGGRRRLADDSLGDVFGIEMSAVPAKKKPVRKKVARKKSVKRKPAKKKAARKSVKKKAGRSSKEISVVKKRSRNMAGENAVQLKNPTGRLDCSGSAVAALRKKFAMTVVEFALLLGVSPPTVKNWEARPGRIKLHEASREALRKAKKLSKRKAWQQLQEL